MPPAESLPFRDVPSRACEVAGRARGRHGSCCKRGEESVVSAMSQRKLHKVAASPVLREWAASCPDDTFAGTARIETQHATYLFRNGSCFAVSGRGRRGGTVST